MAHEELFDTMGHYHVDGDQQWNTNIHNLLYNNVVDLDRMTYEEL